MRPLSASSCRRTGCGHSSSAASPLNTSRSHPLVSSPVHSRLPSRRASPRPAERADDDAAAAVRAGVSGDQNNTTDHAPPSNPSRPEIPAHVEPVAHQPDAAVLPSASHAEPQQQLRSARDADARVVAAPPVVLQAPVDAPEAPPARHLPLHRILVREDTYESSFESESPAVRRQQPATIEAEPAERAAGDTVVATPAVVDPPAPIQANPAVSVAVVLQTESVASSEPVSNDPDAPHVDVPQASATGTPDRSARVPKLDLSHAHDAVWLRSVGVHDDALVTQLLSVGVPRAQSLQQYLSSRVSGAVMDVIEQLRVLLQGQDVPIHIDSDDLKAIASGLVAPAP
jgi:hypothetical protein